jgi:hypothetical protein
LDDDHIFSELENYSWIEGGKDKQRFQ